MSKKILSILLFCLVAITTTLLLSKPPQKSVTIMQSPADHHLTTLGTFNWPTWEKEPSEFVWQFSEREIAYLLEGEVFVTPEGSQETFHFKKGDLAYFEAGLRCKWKITKPLKKHVILEENKPQEIYWKVAFKLKKAARHTLNLIGSVDHVYMENALNT